MSENTFYTRTNDDASRRKHCRRNGLYEICEMFLIASPSVIVATARKRLVRVRNYLAQRSQRCCKSGRQSPNAFRLKNGNGSCLSSCAFLLCGEKKKSRALRDGWDSYATDGATQRSYQRAHDRSDQRRYKLNDRSQKGARVATLSVCALCEKQDDQRRRLDIFFFTASSKTIITRHRGLR